MFHLETAIITWRSQLRAAGITSQTILDELESHLREDVERQVKSGRNASEAFEISASRVGPPEILGREFDKSERTSERKWGIFSILTGAVIILRIFTHRDGGQPWKNDELGWILSGTMAMFWGLNTVWLRFSLGASREVRLWKLTGIVFSMVAVLISTLPLLQIFKLPGFNSAFGPAHRILASAALAVCVLSVFGWRRCRKILPVIEGRRFRTVIGIACCLAGPAGMAIFFSIIFPQLGHFPAPVFLVLQAWLWTAMAVLGGVGYGLEEAAQPATDRPSRQQGGQYV